MFDLSGRVAVVTGGNGGIGLGIARGLAQAGAAIAIWARDAAKNEAAVKELEGLGARALALPCDVGEEVQLARAVSETVAALGRIDVCVANAGFGLVKSTLELSLEEWRQVTRVDLDGVFLSFREVAKHMVARGGGGKLIAISSIGEIYGMARQGDLPRWMGDVTNRPAVWSLLDAWSATAHELMPDGGDGTWSIGWACSLAESS